MPCILTRVFTGLFHVGTEASSATCPPLAIRPRILPNNNGFAILQFPDPELNLFPATSTLQPTAETQEKYVENEGGHTIDEHPAYDPSTRAVNAFLDRYYSRYLYQNQFERLIQECNRRWLKLERKVRRALQECQTKLVESRSVLKWNRVEAEFEMNGVPHCAFGTVVAPQPNV